LQQPQLPTGNKSLSRINANDIKYYPKKQTKESNKAKLHLKKIDNSHYESVREGRQTQKNEGKYRKRPEVAALNTKNDAFSAYQSKFFQGNRLRFSSI
jgi:hypothetical protein